jgi:hypothetical protein
MTGHKGHEHQPGDGHSHDSEGSWNLGLLTAILMDSPKKAPPPKAEPYVEPDFEAVWSRRWRVLKPVLIAIVVGAIAYTLWVTNS